MEDELSDLRASFGGRHKSSLPPIKKSAAPRNEKKAAPAKPKSKIKAKPILVLPNFGGRRCPAEGPKEVREWGLWDCDPTQTGPPKQHHAFGSEFPWTFDMEEKAYVLEGTATLTPDDVEKHGEACDIGPKDMVTFPKGWTGTWKVHSFLKKRYAFFTSDGIRVDEDESDDEPLEEVFEEEEEDWEEGCESSKPRKAKPVALDRDGKLDAEIEQMRTGQDDTSNKRPAVESGEPLGWENKRAKKDPEVLPTLGGGGLSYPTLGGGL